MKKSIYLFACLALLTSCRAKKEILPHITGIENSQLRFETCVKSKVFKESLQSKLNVELFLPEKKFTSRATLKIVNGQFIQLSLLPLLGIEIFRVVLSPDNILIIDRMNKRYVSEPIEALEELLKVDVEFNMLQALFTNQLFYPHQEEPLKFKFFNDTTTPCGIAYSPKVEANYNCAFLLDSTARLVRTTIEDFSQRAALQWDYSEFVSVAKTPFPSRMEITLPSSDDVGLQIKLSDFQTDTTIEIDTSVTSRYEKISFSQLYNMLQKTL